MDVVAHVVKLVIAFNGQSDFSQGREFANGVGFVVGVVANVGKVGRLLPKAAYTSGGRREGGAVKGTYMR